MKKTTHAAWCSALALGCALIAGCSSGLDLETVTGRVTLSGKPLEGAMVEFQPTAKDSSPSYGETDADGRYKLMYTPDKAGALAGEHVVRITTGGSFMDDEGNEVERKERVPAKYNTKSELKRTVKPGKNTFDFEL